MHPVLRKLDAIYDLRSALIGAALMGTIVALINLSHGLTPALTAAAKQARVEPIYEELPGWSESTEGATRWLDLPAEAIKYIKRVEELIQCPVAILSTSPERDDTILVTDPFAD